MKETISRNSKYIVALSEYMSQLGHATNTELLKKLRQKFPELSATTVHRITARMFERGELRLAPNGARNVMRYDNNLLNHDHFMCEGCGDLKDAILDKKARKPLEKAIGEDCSIAGSIMISGICKKCRGG